MPADVKKLLKRLAGFLMPFVLYTSAIVVIDPYNYFGSNSPVSNELKREIPFKLNYAMWKMLEYRHDPQSNILLGDSRMMKMDEEAISSLTRRQYYNFAYGGGSLKEAIATFHFADNLTSLESVTIGLDINSYNGSDNKDRVTEVLGSLDNPFLYITNNNVFLSAWKMMVSIITGNSAYIGQPIGNKDDFWKNQLEVTARIYFANYREPIIYRRQLQEISEICGQKNIALSFIIFPSHKDLMDKAHQFGLDDANQAMRQDLASFGEVYDFAWDNEVTRNKEKFKDPYHFTAEVEESIIESVWGNHPHLVKIYGR